MNIDNDQKETISHAMGDRLRQLRIRQNESQVIFAQRVGVSRQTYAKMENGNSSTPISLWIEASILLSHADDWTQIFKDHRSLFDQYDEQQKQLPQRMRRKKQ